MCEVDFLFTVIGYLDDAPIVYGEIYKTIVNVISNDYP